MHAGVTANHGVVGSRNGAGALAKVNVRILNGPRLTIRVNLNSSVQDFRPLVTRNCRIHAEEQLLIYKGRVMKDDQTLKSYGLEDGANVDMVVCRATDVPGTRNANSASTGLGRLPQRPEDLVGNLEYLDVSTLNDLANNPEALRNLYMNNTRMLAICSRNLGVLRRILNACAGSNFERSSEGTENSAVGRPQTNSGAYWVIPIESNMDASSGGLGFHSIDQMSISQMRPNIGFDPQLQSMLRSNHQVSPEIGQMASHQIVNFHGAHTSQSEAAQNDGGTVLPEERYATQLIQLRTMGFFDIQKNIRALTASAGNVRDAAQRLLLVLE